MKRIGLFLGVRPHAGGMFQYAQSLLDALCALPCEEYEVQIAYVGTDWERVLASYPFTRRRVPLGDWGLFLATACMVARLPDASVRIASSWLNPIARSLGKMACDLWIFPAQDAVAYQLRLPTLVTIHDLMHRYEPHFPEVVKGRRYLIREHRFRNLAKWSQGILVDSEMGRTHVVDSYGVCTDKIFSLPYVPGASACNALVDDSFDGKYRLPGKFLFYPAQFWAHKNHAALLRAAASIRPICQDIHLVFTGALRFEYDNLLALAKSLDMMESVSFCGYVPDADLPHFYRRARAMVMPTFFGPTNIPPLEALLHSCPVAVSDIYGMPEQLGDAALYFDPRSIESMAAILERLWTDDGICETLKNNGGKRLAAWNPATFAQRLRQILDRLLSGPCTTYHP